MDEKIIGLDKNKDIDRRLEETTKQLQREREKLMAVIRMSGDLIFEYDIAKDQMHFFAPSPGSGAPQLGQFRARPASSWFSTIS